MNYRLSEETGNVVALLPVTETDDLMLITNEGVVIRMDAGEISTVGRVTKGVRLMRLTDGVKIVSATAAAKEEEDGADEEEAETEAIVRPEEEE